jgi:predicted nucleic acid-binding protein
MKFLIDTNIPSELLRPRPHPGVIRWLSAQTSLAISAICVHESIFGLTQKGNLGLLAAYENFIDTLCTVLPVDDEIARRAGTLRGNLAHRGFVRSLPDMLIAATAQQHNLTLVTRNTRDFEGCGIGLLNPFTD